MVWSDTMASSSTRAAETPVEVEFTIRDRDCFFVGVSATESCHLSLEHLVRRSDGRLLEFFSVSGTDPDRVLARAAETDAIDRAWLVGRGGEEALCGFVVSGSCVTTTLADSGAVTRSVSATCGDGRVVAAVPPAVSVREVVETFQSRHADTDLLARRDSVRPMPVRTERGARAALTDRLTDKQLEVLRTAFLHGYFDWPRGSTAEECADALDIAQPTFSQHVRSAQQKVFAALFDGSSPDR